MIDSLYVIESQDDSTVYWVALLHNQLLIWILKSAHIQEAL